MQSSKDSHDPFANLGSAAEMVELMKIAEQENKLRQEKSKSIALAKPVPPTSKPLIQDFDKTTLFEANVASMSYWLDTFFSRKKEVCHLEYGNKDTLAI